MFIKQIKYPFLILIIIYILIIIFLLLYKKNFEKKNNNYEEKIDDNNIIYVGRKLTSNCNYLVCPEGNGYCRADRCVCLSGYVTYSEDDNENEGKNKKFCNYKQKSVLTALILESIGLSDVVIYMLVEFFLVFLKLLFFIQLFALEHSLLLNF